MRKVLLVHISSSGCCNTLVTMLNNGDFGFPYCATHAFSTPAVWCRVFQSRVFSRPAVFAGGKVKRNGCLQKAMHAIVALKRMGCDVTAARTRYAMM